LAEPFQYTFSGTWSFRSSPDWGGPDFTLTLIADNGGSTHALQLCERGDFTSVTIESDGEIIGGEPEPGSSTGYFRTNEFGELQLGWNESKVIRFGTPDQAAIVFDGMTIRLYREDEYAVFNIPRAEERTFRGSPLSGDSDQDGIIDAQDQCLGASARDAMVDDSGCSVAQICPCENDWKSHRAYVRCIARASEAFVETGLITEEEKEETLSAAGSSRCGRER
jgi:hypothetical protein